MTITLPETGAQEETMTTIAEPRTTVPRQAPAAASTPEPAASTPADEHPKESSSKVRNLLALVGIGGSLFVGIVGFVASFSTLTNAAEQKWGFSPDVAPWFAGAVDASIVSFLALDLLMALFGVGLPLLRLGAHLMTAATIVLNATAHGSITGDPIRAAAHGLMPVLFVVGIEAGRRILMKRTALATGVEADPIPVHRWLLAPFTTWGMFRRMKLWAIRSYTQAVELEKELTIYRVWLKHREELEEGQEEGAVGALDRLPMTMRKYGMSVDEALALPDRMRRDEQRRQQEAEARRLELELEKEQAQARAEVERLRLQGDIAAVRAEVDAATGVAAARAEAATASARLEAATTLSAAERAAQENERRAAAEAAAEESAVAAEARARAAEADRLAAEARAEEEAANAAAAEAAARKAEADRAATEAARAAAEADRKTALLRADEEAAKAAAAEARRAAAEAEAAAVEAEDRLKLTPAQRDARLVARMILRTTGGNAEALDLQTIADTLGVSAGTASKRRQEAAELLADGYRA